MFTNNPINLFQMARNGFIFFDSTISFTKNTTTKKNSNQTLCLFDIAINENYLTLFKLMPKRFTITTNTGSSKFNVDMLIKASPVINDYIQADPNHLQYHINIDDNENVLQKIELLFQCNPISFTKEEFIIFNQIIANLQMKNCFNITNKRFLHLNLSIFSNFLRLKSQLTFKISTKKQTYICNKFGILSSSILADFISKDSKLDQYEYDYEDEFNDFQIICDFFNFQEISITQKNIDSIREIAEDLKINHLIENIDKSMTEFKKISEQIDDSQTINESIDNLFYLLYNINKITVKSVFNSIIMSEWIKSIESIQELAAFILQVIKNDLFLHPYLIDLLEQLNKASEEKENGNLKILIPFIIKHLMELTGKFNSNCSFLYKLYKKKYIELEEIIKLHKKALDNMNDMHIMCIYSWFLPELIENNLYNESFVDRFQTNMKSFFYSFINFYYPNNIGIYKKMRDDGEPNDEITKALRHDDVDKLQSIISMNVNDKSMKSFVPYNIFDYFPSNGRINYINYAAAYGSIKCFKYLLLNHQTLNKQSFLFAIFGGNIEIIKIIDQTPPDQISNDDDNNNNNNANQINSLNIYKNGALLSIKKHKNDIFDWIFDNKFSENDKKSNFYIDLLKISAENGNMHALIAAIDSDFDILNDKLIFMMILEIASQNGFLKYSTFLSNIIENKPNMLINISDDIFYFIFFGNLSIFKIGEKYATNASVKSLIYAAEYNYQNIVEYILSKSTNDKIICGLSDKINAICNSLKHKSLELFEYLMERFQFFKNNENINVQNYLPILDSAIVYNQFEVVKKVVDIILKKNPEQEFTTSLLKSLQSKSKEICYYLIDNKLTIDYKKIAASIRNDNIMFFDEKLYNIIRDNIESDFDLRESFDENSLYIAIRKKNVQFVDYLLSRNIKYDNILFDAANTNVEIVKTIFKYYKIKPSFINRLSSEGTALAIATKNNNIPIVEFLLSIPEINPNIFDRIDISAAQTIISSANISNKNKIKLLTLFLNSDKFDINICHRNNAYNYNSILNSAIDDGYEEIALLILKYPKTDINYRNAAKITPLILAVEKNYLSIVDFILNDERFEPDESRLDYAFIISGGEVMLHLASSKYLNVNKKIECNSFNNKTTAYSPLYYATIKNDFEKVDIIINHPSFNIENKDLKYVIFKSIEMKQIDLFKKLVGLKNFDINSFEYENCGLFQIALSLNSFEILGEILNNPKFIPKQIDIPMAFIKFINLNDPESIVYIKKLFEYVKTHQDSFDLNKPLPDKNSLFTTIPQEQKDMNIVNLLLENGVDPNIPDEYGMYPLEHAISLESHEFVQALLNSNKIDYSKKIQIRQNYCQSKVTPQIISKYFSLKNIETTNQFMNNNNNNDNDSNSNPKRKRLFENTTNVVISRNDKCCSYLHLAAKCKNSVILTEFLDRKLIDVNIKDDDGNTPLIIACRYINEDNIRLLLSIDDIDYQHRNDLGKDALDTIKSETKIHKISNLKKEISNKDEYCQQILSLIEQKNNENERTKKKINVDYKSNKSFKFNPNKEEYKAKNTPNQHKKNINNFINNADETHLITEKEGIPAENANVESKTMNKKQPEEEYEKKIKEQKEKEKELELREKMQKEKEKELELKEQMQKEKEKELEMKKQQIEMKEKELEMKEKLQNEKVMNNVEQNYDEEIEQDDQYLDDGNLNSPYEMQTNQMIQQQWLAMMQSGYIRQANFESQMRIQTQFLHNLLNTKSKKKKSRKKSDK